MAGARPNPRYDGTNAWPWVPEDDAAIQGDLDVGVGRRALPVARHATRCVRSGDVRSGDTTAGWARWERFPTGLCPLKLGLTDEERRAAS